MTASGPAVDGGAPSDDPRASLGGPLDGLLVADFSRVLAGPMATMTLADLGATVIKIERPGVGDETRTWGPPWSARSTSYFEGVNRSKRSIALDLADAADRATALDIARRADVLIENFKPGTMDRLGLGYDAVAAANPGVVYCSISGFGSTGGAHLPGYDFVAQAVGGLMSVTGAAGGEPTKVGVALVDVLTGKDAVIGILAAVAGRARTGRGDRIEVSLLTSVLGGLVNQAQAYLETGTAPRALGNDHPSIAPYGCLRARDGLLAVACGNDGQFRRLATALGLEGAGDDHPGLAGDPRFVSNADRVAHRHELTRLLEQVTVTADVAEWVERLSVVGVPAGAVNDIGAAIDLAESLGLEPTVEVGPDWSRQVRHPVRWSAYTTAAPTPPPANDAHGDAVRRWLDGDGSALLG